MKAEEINVRTKNGANIKVHFQSEHLRNALWEDLDSLFERFVKNEDFGEKDTGEGSTVYFLINNHVAVRCLTEEEYLQWEKDQKWGNPIPMVVIEIVTEVRLPPDIDDSSSMYERFKGSPTKEELEKYESDPVYWETLSNDPDNCSICLELGCEGRMKDFDAQALEALMSIKKPS